ncbi:hypothetical protein [Candidatus Vallotia tarda]|uniref:hypothetical protein n=1 Tax=Candidatus Vallotiella hemipterorum TaxID=1177213 RepID=UPI001C1F67C4|nr:hypothetical protein [Candidatus Vallotia tarda]
MALLIPGSSQNRTTLARAAVMLAIAGLDIERSASNAYAVSPREQPVILFQNF